MKFCRVLIILIALLSVSYLGFSQSNRIADITHRLDSLSKSVPVLNDSIDISVTNVSIQEFLRGIAIANNVNISIANGLNDQVVNNFNNVKFKDVLIFLVKEYDLDIELLGNIIVVKKYIAPKAPIKKYVPRTILITKNVDDTYTLDLQNDTLKYVAKKLAQLSGKNIIVRSDIRNLKVSCYVQNQSIQNVIEHIAMSNDLDFEIEAGNTLVLSSIKTTKKSASNSRSRSSKRGGDNDYIFQYTVVDSPKKTMSINAYQAPLDTIVRTIVDVLKIQYHKISDFDGQITLVAQNIAFEDLLKVLFKGTKYSYKSMRGVYLLGEEKVSGMQETKLIQLEFRTVENHPKPLKLLSKLFMA